MTKEALEILLEKYEKGSCSPEEMAFMNALFERYVASKSTGVPAVEKQALLQRIRKGIQQETSITLDKAEENDVNDETAMPSARLFGATPENRKPGRSLIFKRKRFAAAAAILVLLLGGYWLSQRYPDAPERQAPQAGNRSLAIRPGTTSASLVLGNGRRIGLDSTRSSDISTIQVGKGTVSLRKKNGQQVYLSTTAALNVYNTLLTERGQQAPEMTLADGTKVWLNAASSLHFPVQFSGATREVTLTGEAYFEVAKDVSHPFVVKTENSRIKVLGTHFNVMAYHDEPNTYATLLEGSIQIDNKRAHAKLIPGEQATISHQGNITVATVETQQFVAWLHGKLPMDNMDVHAFLREVSRWYDVDIVYKTQIPAQTFSGNLKRDIPLTHIISALKANGIHAELRDKTITVNP